MSSSPELVSFDSQLAEIDRKLAQLQAQRDALLFEQARIARLRALYVGARAPWRRLPVELISEIFVRLLNEETSSKSPEAYTLPTTLSLVSSEWRTLALSNPRLWANIRIHTKCGSRTADTWLKRSKSAPIVLRCWLYRQMPESSYRMALEHIRNHSHHIFDLEIMTNDNERYIGIIGTLNRSFPMLHAFRVRDDQNVSAWTRNIPDDLTENIFDGGRCPNLRSLDIISPCSWPIGLFENLTKLAFLEIKPDPHWHHLIRLLEHASNVAELTIVVDDTLAHDFSSLPEPITLSAMICLSIDGFLEDAVGLLSCLRLPRIRSLTIMHHGWWFGGPTVGALPDSMASFPLLERLKVTSEDMYPGVPEHLPHILRRCDNVKELHIDSLDLLTTLVRHLDTPDGQVQPMCPRLMHLYIEQSNDHPPTFGGSRDPIREFLSSRTNPEGALMAGLQTLSFLGRRSSPHYLSEQAASYRLLAKSIRYNGIEL